MSTSDFSNQLNEFQLFLHNFAMRLTRDNEKAKDLMQDTSIRAFRYRAKFKPGTNFKGWIATIMRNTFINNYRKEKRNRTVSEPVEALAYGLESKNRVHRYDMQRTKDELEYIAKKVMLQGLK